MLHAPKTIIATKNDGWETTFILGSSVGVQIASPKPTACRWWWWWWFQWLLQFLNWNSRDIIQIWRTYLANGCDKTRKNTYYTLENSMFGPWNAPNNNTKKTTAIFGTTLFLTLTLAPWQTCPIAWEQHPRCHHWNLALSWWQTYHR